MSPVTHDPASHLKPITDSINNKEILSTIKSVEAGKPLKSQQVLQPTTPDTPLWWHHVVAVLAATSSLPASVIATPVVVLGGAILLPLLVIVSLILCAFNGQPVILDGNGLFLLMAGSATLGGGAGLLFSSFEVFPTAAFTYMCTMESLSPAYQPSEFTHKLSMLSVFRINCSSNR